MKVVAITSPIHKESAADPSKESFIQSIEALVGEKFEFCSCDSAIDGRIGTYDSSVNGKSVFILFVYVRTGGTEGIFKKMIHSYLSCSTQSEPAAGLSYEENREVCRQEVKVILITSGESNSLAASMEILSYLQGRGLEGEILHGSPDFIASKIREIIDGEVPGSSYVYKSESESCCIKPFESVDLGGARLGVIGRPSDWLISSNVDYAKAKECMNVELVDISMDELLLQVNGIQNSSCFGHASACNAGDIACYNGSTENTSDDSKMATDVMRGFRGSEIIYEALKYIVNKYGLKGLTLRCFDLLYTVHNTGCMALARLNAEGIAASCEGDVPALLSMYYLLSKRGCPGFQCNLSSINGDKLLFAHCTVPLSMVDSYRYMTHFESGIGTAIKGEMPLGRVEIFKIAPDLERCVTIAGEIVENQSKPNLCRTQIVVKAPGAANYFLRSPLANHHIISYL